MGIQVVEAQIGVPAQLGGDVQLGEQGVEALVAGLAERGDGDVEDLALGRRVAVGVAAEASGLLEQDDVVRAAKIVAGGKSRDAAPDDRDAPSAVFQNGSGLNSTPWQRGA
ncbi:MAG: hypothetical protein HY927_14455 [Elusimicrobia bacterium]|nr:hypothetical protein [Elusimicrobiota bacterium]